MKYQKYVKRNMHTPYKHYYLDYSVLRKSLDMDAQSYKTLVDSNVNKVFDFVSMKSEELNRRLDKKISLKKLNEINEELRIFTEFIRINIAGFRRALKRRDRKNNESLYKEYRQIFREKEKEMDKLSDLIYRSSQIMLSRKNKKKSNESNSCFIRNTDKYWVHKNNINSLKFFVLQHLPIYVFNKDIEEWNYNTHDTNISSVYFDSTDYCLYTDRLKKIQSSEAIRIRWYGKEISDVVFIERKRHEDGWTGECSKKLRFKLYENKVMDFCAGKDVWDEVIKLNDESDDLKLLYDEIQTAIVVRKLRPMVRTCYKRVAFQLPNDSSVRISLDTDLCMIKENTDHWRRLDINIDDIVRFPYAILEVKTQCLEEDKPEWILELTRSALVEHVHKFSKYLHGMSVLYPDIKDIPYWLPQMTTRILKDPYEEKTEYKEFNNQVPIDIVPEEEIDSEKLSPVDVQNKRISIPVRVEPKVFFANERTFLSWVQFAIFLGGIGTAMLGIDKDKSLLGGITLIGVSIVFSFYALYLYLWRAGMIRRRDPGPYDDIYGPPVLVGVFLFAMFLAIIFKFPLKRII
jgi:SPX domain protein involved in polyphosphate accumulation/uncharacterized membrane protein YidH (DUF202 family)